MVRCGKVTSDDQFCLELRMQRPFVQVRQKIMNNSAETYATVSTMNALMVNGFPERMRGKCILSNISAHAQCAHPRRAPLTPARNGQLVCSNQGG